MIHIGILALQGNFHQHSMVLQSLKECTIEIHFLRNHSDLISHDFDGIILPGGETSTMLHLLYKQNMREMLISMIKNNMPVLATCAGAILLSKYEDIAKDYHAFNTAQITIERNAYGRQYNSFIAEFEFNIAQKNRTLRLPRSHIKGLFIRAPKITQYGNHVSILASHNNDAIIIQEKNMLISTCHPEAVPDNLLHQYFIQHMIINK